MMNAPASWSAAALRRFFHARVFHAPTESARGLAQSKTLARIGRGLGFRQCCPVTAAHCTRPNFFSSSFKLISISVGRPCGQV